MSIAVWNKYDGKVVSTISLTETPPGGKTEYSVRIDFKDGSGFELKSQSSITIEERIK